MKTLVISISDAAAEQLAKSAADGKHTAEDLAAHVVEGAFAEDWFADLDSEDRAAIEEGWAQAERGEFASDEEIEEAYSRFGR